MSIKTVITHQYHLPMSIEEMVALSDGRCAALSWRKDAG